MMGRTHLAIGLLVALVLVPFVQDKALLLGLVLLGALLPDVDSEGSTINKRVPLTRIIPMFFKHRGFFHSVFPPIIIGVCSLVVGMPAVGLYVSIGYLSHLCSDALTQSGVNFFYPLSTFQMRGFVRTGGLLEMGVMVIILALDAGVAVYWSGLI